MDKRVREKEGYIEKKIKEKKQHLLPMHTLASSSNHSTL